MSPRAILIAWLLCAALLGAGALAVLDADRRAPPLFHGAPIAVIGSSQTNYAFAKQGGGADSLLGDGRAHYRIGLPAISEAETLHLLARAIDEGADQVFVEAWPLVYDLGPMATRGRCDQPARALRVDLKRGQLRLTDAAARLLGRAASTDDSGDPLLQTREEDLPPLTATDAAGYTLVLRGPCALDRMTALVAQARTRGTAVVLVAPPRSQLAQGELGAAQNRALDAAARDLAARLHVPLFAPASPWPDSAFITIGHTSRAGRERMRADLRAWLAQEAGR